MMSYLRDPFMISETVCNVVSIIILIVFAILVVLAYLGCISPLFLEELLDKQFRNEKQTAMLKAQICFALGMRERLQSEIDAWIARKREELGEYIGWRWDSDIATYDRIIIYNGGEYYSLKLDIVSFGDEEFEPDADDLLDFAHIKSVSFTDEDGKTYTGQGPSLQEIPESQYESYFKALIQKNMPFFSEAVKKLEGINSVSFTFKQAVGCKAESKVEFDCFLQALNEELAKIGVFAIGNYATQIIEIAKAK